MVGLPSMGVTRSTVNWMCGSVNERMEFPRAYVPLLRSLGNQNMKQ